MTPRLALAAALLALGCSPVPAAAVPPRSPSSTTPASLLPLSAPATPKTAVPDAPSDAAARAQIIDAALKNIVAQYVDPDVAAKLVASVRAHQSRGDYDHVASSVAFAALLTSHFAEAAHDKHLSIKYTPRVLPADPDPSAKPDPGAAAAAEAAERAANRFDNGGFYRVERFPGNIGYVKFDRFAGPWEAGEAAVAAMSFIADADALIMDLIDNQGGYPQMVALLASYLFDGWPVQLSGIYSRDTGQTEQAWTTSFVPGKRYGKEKPVYVLTSAKTVSAAEAFAYDLQAVKRATIVGEVTMGGANPGNVFRVTDHFHMQIAQGRAVNPVTKTNWEGTGVTPDVRVRADLALATARLMALKERAGKTDDPDQKQEVEGATRDVEQEIERAKGRAAR